MRGSWHSVRENPLLARLGFAAVCVAVLLAAALATRPLEAPAWEKVRARKPELNLGEMEDALGQGVVIGVLGGFRTILADFLWIRLHGVWEDREREKLVPLIRLVTTLDPRPEYFWINGARMVAYDVPNWRIREEGGYEVVPEQRQTVIDTEQARRAFALLDEALAFHPRSARLHLEKAQIYLNRLDAVEEAAEWFLKATRLPDAPRYAARIYAELLKRQEKYREAYEFLKSHHAALPEDDPGAMKPVVLSRIRELEERLAVPPGERYAPEN